MGNQSFLDSVRERIGGVAFRVFLWCNGFSEDEYFTLMKLDFLRDYPNTCEHGYNGICPKCDAMQTPPSQNE